MTRMLERFAIPTLISILLLAFPVMAEARNLGIMVEASANKRYLIRVHFAGDSDGETEFVLPNEWGGQRELFKSISGLTVSPASAVLTKTEKPHVLAISHRAGQELIVSYEISNGFEGHYRNDIRYRPVIDDAYIHWIGNAVWALPAWDDATEINVKLEWNRLPERWVIANSFAAGKRSQNIRTTKGELRQAVFVAGDFRLVRAKANGNPVNLAIRGTWKFTDAELVEMTRRVIEIERNFFSDHSQKYYLVTLVPIDGGGPNSISIGGTGLTDSFALFATTNAGLSQFRQLLAHEYAHNWIPGKLGKMPGHNEQALYWFSEGFTEFYTYELLHRGGLITPAEYLDRYNELIREYYTLPVREAPNDRVVTDFWSNRHMHRLPYLRGFLFAANMHYTIKKASGGKYSLDNVIFDLIRASQSKKQELSFESLASAFGARLAYDPAPLMRQQLLEGQTIKPHPDALGEGYSQQNVRIPLFELGFDFEKLVKNRVVTDLDPESSAFAAGLRNGQQLTAGVSFTFGDISRPIELRVKDREGEKSVKFLPVAREKMEVPQYTFNRLSH